MTGMGGTPAAWEIEIAGQRHAARASLRPLYDPKGSGFEAETQQVMVRGPQVCPAAGRWFNSPA